MFASLSQRNRFVPQVNLLDRRELPSAFTGSIPTQLGQLTPRQSDVMAYDSFRMPMGTPHQMDGDGKTITLVVED